jgi:hypothetical protein
MHRFMEEFLDFFAEMLRSGGRCGLKRAAQKAGSTPYRERSPREEIGRIL